MQSGLYPGLLGRGLFCQNWERNRTKKLGINIAGVRCKICEFCMILKKLQLGMGPVFSPCEMRDKALAIGLLASSIFKLKQTELDDPKGPENIISV